MQTDAIYGEPPIDLGLVDIKGEEMLFWLYCPIKLPDQFQPAFPKNLEQFRPIVWAVYEDMGRKEWEKNYIYITAKRMVVSAGMAGNRPGWHSDGFLTGDINYAWYDSVPTVFWEPNGRYSVTADHNESLKEFHDLANRSEKIARYPNMHLLKMNQQVIHKPDVAPETLVRTFVKVSVSKHKYTLKGNSINHELPLHCVYGEREKERNCPIGKQ